MSKSRSEPRELLQELQRLEELRDPAVTQSKRKFDRYVVRVDAELLHMDRSIPEQVPVPVMLRDLGRGGVGFVSPIPLEVDSTWHLAFLKDGYVVGRQGLVIRHCRPIRDAAFLVGGQFCIDSGLMTLLGVHPTAIRDGSDSIGESDDAAGHEDSFLSPEDLTQER